MGLQLHAGPAVSFNHSGHKLISLEFTNFAFKNIQAETYQAVGDMNTNLFAKSSRVFNHDL